MSKVKQMIAEQVQDGIRAHVTNGRGSILSHDLGSNTAKVAVTLPASGRTILDGVPIRSNPGMHASRMRTGTKVYIEFIEGDPKQAVIVAVADESYHRSTRLMQKHQRKGAFIPECLSERSEF